MQRLILSRLGQLATVLFMLSLFTFMLMKLAPGDPVRSILRADEVLVTKSDEEAVRKELGLDQPWAVQYSHWLWRVIQLDLGVSYVSGRPVLDELLDRLLPTVYLALGGLLVMIVIALPLGTLAAVFHHRLLDHVSRMLAFIGASLPQFWLGLLLVYIFAYQLKLLPSMGEGSFKHIILPSVTLGLGMAAVYARLLRAGLLESFSQDYIRAARSRGLPEWQILMGHAMRAGLLPVITMLGMSLGHLLGGAVVVETLFSWPGLGKLVVDAVFKRDYPIIQGYILFTGLFVVMANLVIDLSYRWLDPRIRFGKDEKQ
ncbi:peptide/nickel transport system permease protein [Caldalkalibacillus uzonensis]|uniref:Nickel import system permease protein NikB n=1 Tax=Caldalkalibacillus uzonensis TaxID=353224 RepID=A0ABU0CRK4_9BACI|nr:nickel ABC transporter permease [Caldalkalibacillus uzonensis]MDQ0339054.1 peptide/nickel transport system permease protein [Caldalkalibacillus uzonensis]